MTELWAISVRVPDVPTTDGLAFPPPPEQAAVKKQPSAASRPNGIEFRVLSIEPRSLAIEKAQWATIVPSAEPVPSLRDQTAPRFCAAGP
jgi:hypothetical protein